MENRVEYLINVTAVYSDGRKNSMLIRHKDSDGQAARDAVRDMFRNYEKNDGVKYLITTLVGPAQSSSRAA